MNLEIDYLDGYLSHAPHLLEGLECSRIVGHNKNWKQEVNIGKVNNQKFVQIPFDQLIH